MIDSIKKYRVFDIAILSILAAICEVGGEILHIELPGAGYYISFAILVAMIGMVRWGYYGTIIYVVAGIPMILVHEGALVENILLYPFSYMFLGLANVFFIFVDRNNVRENGVLLLCYTLISHVSVSLGKGITMYILSGEFLEGVISYNLVQLFSIVIVFIVLLIVRRSKGLLVNMEDYLIEVNSNNKDI